MDKIQTEYLSFRAEPHHRRKLRQLATSTGLSISNVLRQLVEAAEVQPVTQLKPTARITSKSSGSLPVNAGIVHLGTVQ